MYCEQKSCRNKKRNCDLRQLSYFYLNSLVPKERHVRKESNDSTLICVLEDLHYYLRSSYVGLSPILICRLMSEVVSESGLSTKRFRC